MADDKPKNANEPSKPDDTSSGAEGAGQPEAPKPGAPPKAQVPQAPAAKKAPVGGPPQQRRIVIPLRATQAIKVRKAPPKPEEPAAVEPAKPAAAKKAGPAEGDKPGKVSIPLRATQSIKATKKKPAGKKATGRRKVSIPLRATQAIKPSTSKTAAKTSTKKAPAGKAVPLRATQPIMPKSPMKAPAAQKPSLTPADPNEMEEISQIKDAVPMRDTKGIRKSLSSSATRIPIFEPSGPKKERDTQAMPRSEAPGGGQPHSQPPPSAQVPMKATQPIKDEGSAEKRPVTIPMRATQPIEDLGASKIPTREPMKATQSISEGKESVAEAAAKLASDKSRVVAHKATQPIPPSGATPLPRPTKIAMSATQPISPLEEKQQSAEAKKPVGQKPPTKKTVVKKTLVTKAPATGGAGSMPPPRIAPVAPVVAAKPAEETQTAQPPAAQTTAPSKPAAPTPEPSEKQVVTESKSEPPAPEPKKEPAAVPPPAAPKAPPKISLGRGSNQTMRLDVPDQLPEKPAPAAAASSAPATPPPATPPPAAPPKLAMPKADVQVPTTAPAAATPPPVVAGDTAPPKITLAPSSGPAPAAPKPVPATEAPKPLAPPQPAPVAKEPQPANKLTPADTAIGEAAKSQTMPLDVPDALPTAEAKPAAAAPTPPPAPVPAPPVALPPKPAVAPVGISPTDDMLATAEKNMTMPIEIPGDEAAATPPPPAKPKLVIPKAAAAAAGAGAGAAAASAATDAKVGIPAARKSETSRIDLTEAKPAREMTMAVEDMPTIMQSVPQGVPSQLKKDTSRVDISEVAKGSPTPKLGIPAAAKSETSRIDISAAHTAGATDAEKQKAITSSLDNMLKQAQEATMRIEIEDTGRAGTDLTQPVQAISAEANRERTAKVDLSNILGKDKAGAPKTVVRPRPGGTQPKTMKIKRPGTTEASAAKTIAKTPDSGFPTATSDGTSKIDLPEGPGAPTVQRKTIRIKRPGGTSAVGGTPPTLQIARPEDGASKPEMGGGPMMAMGQTPAAVQSGGKGPGAIFLVLTILTMITAGVLIYALYAQYESIGQAKDTVSKAFPGMIESP